MISALAARPVSTRRKRTGGARRVLVVCPPILLDSWTRELAVVIPHVRSLVIDSIDAAETFARDEGPIVGIVADTMSKLEHARAGFGEAVPFTMFSPVDDRPVAREHRDTFQHGDKRARETRERHGRHRARRPCARCGAEAAMSPSDLANKRARCKATYLEPRNTAARLVLALIDAIGPVWPDAPEIVTHTAEGHHHRQRMLKAWIAALVAKKPGDVRRGGLRVARRRRCGPSCSGWPGTDRVRRGRRRSKRRSMPCLSGWMMKRSPPTWPVGSGTARRARRTGTGRRDSATQRARSSCS